MDFIVKKKNLIDDKEMHLVNTNWCGKTYMVDQTCRCEALRWIWISKDFWWTATEQKRCVLISSVET